MNEIATRNALDGTGYCFRIAETGVEVCAFPNAPRAESGPIRVSLLGRIYTWDNPSADASENLSALAKCIERQGARAAVQRLDGEWALIIEDRSSGTTSIVIDHRGTHPVCMLAGEDVTYVASSMSRICEHASVELDEDRVAIFLSRGDKDHRQPLFAGSQRLGPGLIITLDPTGKVEQEEWLSWSDIETHKPDLEEIRELLFGAVINEARQLAKPIASTLSGGLDSTAVSIALSETPGFSSYSVDAGPNTDNEKEEIDETIRITGMKHSYVPASFGIDDLKALLSVSGEPIRKLKTISTLYTCARRVHEDGKNSMVLGWGPDSYFLWGIQKQIFQYIHYLVTNFFLLTLIRSVPRLSKFHGGGLLNMFRKYVAAEANAFINKGEIIYKGRPDPGHHLKQEYVRAFPQIRPMNLKVRTMKMLTGTTLFPSARAIEEVTGVELAAPFFSRHLTQYILGCESRYMMIDGHTKAMMRKALDGVVPGHVAWPPVKKAIPHRPMEEIAFENDSAETVESLIASSEILRTMMASDPIVAFRSDRETKSNANFWLRCFQVAYLEQLADDRGGAAAGCSTKAK
jgi:asparagine synthetase B (glutamine-hydrolysing)